MRIKKLWISKYKNIKDETFLFDNKLISLFVGQNGLGKSNLLEAVIIIFRELDLAKTEKDLIKSLSKNLFDFYIEYTCNSNHIKVELRNSILHIEVKPIDLNTEFKSASFSSFKLKIANSFLPKFIIGYYSGENKRVRKLFNRHSEIRINNLKKATSDIKHPTLGKMFFTEQNFGELIFFTLWVFKDSKKYGDKIKNLLQGFINIEFSSKVTITFNNPDFYKSYPDKNAENLFENIQNEVETPFWGARGKIDELLNMLYNNNLAHSTPLSYIDYDRDQDKDKNQFVFFNNLNYNLLAKDLAKSINSPIELFDILQAADSIGMVYQIDATINKKGASIKHNFNELSEGEQQLLTVIGLILITGEYDSLFLLDEPDTHLNPLWQREYIKLLEDFNLTNKNSHIFVATHSPLIVQSSVNADVFLFKAVNGDIKIDTNEHKIHNWRIDQVLISDYFNLPSSRPLNLDDYISLRTTILSKKEISKDDEDQLKKFENEYGVLPTGETKEDIEAMLLIRKIIKK